MKNVQLLSGTRVTVPNRQTHRLREPDGLLAKGNRIRLKKSSVSREAEPFRAERFEYGLPYTSDPYGFRKGMLADWAAQSMVSEQPTEERAATNQGHEPANC